MPLALLSLLPAAILAAQTGTAAALRDVGVVEIGAPRGTIDSGAIVTPWVIVSNLGSEEVEFPVALRIGGLYGVSVQETLPAGRIDTVRFPVWIASPPGQFQVTSFTVLAGDENRTNDTLSQVVRVVPPVSHDVGTEVIAAPGGYVPIGDSVIPRAMIRNYGDGFEIDFNVRFRVGAGYDRVGTIDSLPPGAVLELAFPAWTSVPGTSAVSCSTMLASDHNPSNDRRTGYVIGGDSPTHDVAPTDFLSPLPEERLAGGDTVVPRVYVRNYGSQIERYFDVRLRIGTGYDTRVAVSRIAPNSGLEVEFPAWVAVAGAHVASCSTMLGSDSVPDNDQIATTFHVDRRSEVRLGPDGEDRIAAGERRGFRFWAELLDETPRVVQLGVSGFAPGWAAELTDDDGEPLVDSDLNGELDLGRVEPWTRHYFRLAIDAPSTLAGDTSAFSPQTFLVRGSVTNDSGVVDTARLLLSFRPEISLHNYPNPVRAATSFLVGIPDSGPASLHIYDRAGTLVRTVFDDSLLPAGVGHVPCRSVTDSGERLAPGTYHCLLDWRGPDRNGSASCRLVVLPRD